MIIGLLLLEIYLPCSHSLKEKRKRLSSLRDRLRKRFNVAFSELDYQNKWQRTKIGIVTVNQQKKFVENLLNKIKVDAENLIDGEIINHQIHYL